MALGDGQVRRRVGIVGGIVGRVGLTAARNCGCIGHRGRRVARDVHRQRNHWIARARCQSIAASATQRGSCGAGPARPRNGCGRQTCW